MVLRAEGDFKGALDAAERAVAAAKGLSMTSQLVKDGMVEALEAATASQDPTKLGELLAIIDHLPPGELMPYVRAQAARFTSQLALLTGEVERVEPGFKSAIELMRELGGPFWLAVVLLEYGEWLGSQGRRKDADPLFDEAREIFERLEARPWIERLARGELALVEAAT